MVAMGWGKRTACLIASMAGLIFAQIGFAQSADTGAIEGRVTNPSGTVVPLTTVSVRNTATKANRTIETDDMGNYRADLLQPGPYEIVFTKTGFATTRRAGVNVQVGLV